MMDIKSFFNKIFRFPKTSKNKEVEKSNVNEVKLIENEAEDSTIILEKRIIEKEVFIPEKTGYRNITINMNMDNCDDRSEKNNRKEKNYRNIK